MGTSAGALTGSLFCAGYSPLQIATEFSRDPPVKYLQPSTRPWEGGVIAFDGVVGRLRELLPATFEELQREFAVGVVTAQGEYLVIDSGPLPEAVAASAAVPYIFQNVHVPGLGSRNPCKDGGMVDRVGLKGWRERRRAQPGSSVPPCLVHVIHRSSYFSGADDVSATGERDITTVYSPKSGVNLLNLGDFESALQESICRSKSALKHLAVSTSPRQEEHQPEVHESAVGSPAEAVSAYSIGSLDCRDGTSMDIIYNIDYINEVAGLDSVDILGVIGAPHRD